MGRTDSILGQFGETVRCRNANFFYCTTFVNITSKRLDQFAWHFKGRCEVIMGQCDSIFRQFRETARYHDANFFVSNIMSKPRDRFAWNFQVRYGVTMGRPGYIFGQFRETGRFCYAQHGDRVCFAFAPQLVNSLLPPRGSIVIPRVCWLVYEMDVWFVYSFVMFVAISQKVKSYFCEIWRICLTSASYFTDNFWAVKQWMLRSFISRMIQ